MARLVDVIEMMIKEMLDENDGSATISRSSLAERANCVPSQITYVLSTRFSPGNGYIVESRVQHLSKRDYIRSVLDSVGDDLTQQQAKTLLQNTVACGAISAREGTAVMAAVSDRALAKVDTDIRSVVRADVFKNAMLGLMLD